MKKIMVTEQNFNEVITKLQKICNKYKMFELYKVFSFDYKEDKKYRCSSIGFHKELKVLYPDRSYKGVIKFHAVSSYIGVEKHRIREKYESSSAGYIDTKIYEERKPLISMDIRSSNMLIVTEGDYIIFHPFGIFSVWTDNTLIKMKDDDLVRYKHTYIPDRFKGKILSIEAERLKRSNEWADDMNYYYQEEKRWNEDNDDFYNDDEDNEDYWD